MKVVFVSNYFNHHQIPFSESMYKCLGDDYQFIQTEHMEAERVQMGWAIDISQYPYLKVAYDNNSICMKLIQNADIVIVGAAPNEYIDERLKTGKILVKYSERVYKYGIWRIFSPRGAYYMYKAHKQAKKRNMYMLCASGYMAGDMSLWGYYRNRMYKWGYYPECRFYDIEDLLSQKRKNQVCEIVWCSRFIDWKHPEYVIKLADKLKLKGLDFHITMIGVGDLRDKYEQVIKEQSLGKYIDVIGPIKPTEVRGYMERSNVFLMTSDYQEGWGAVINEAMNSGCAVVASHAIGAVPFLMKDGINGLIYKNGNIAELSQLVEMLIRNSHVCEKLGLEAYRTISEEWNAQNAVNRLIELLEAMLNGSSIRFENGPCSMAPSIKQWKMYRVLKNKE